jgi:arylsulfatase
VLACSSLAHAQKTSDAPPLGSPAATRTLDGKQLPAPDLPFGGTIARGALQSKAWWPPRTVPPKHAPNVVLIMTDDTGYGAGSAFGGVIPMPTLDALAAEGLRYTNMHSTALCSPSRAALISGRNHHSMGFGVVSEQATGFPGYDSFLPKDKATIGTILRDNGYATSWFGKNHNTPGFQASQAGPFDQWPSGMGFEYFFGFIGGDTNQWQPNLFRNSTPIYPYVGKPQWNLVTAMADDAIAWMNQLNAITPDTPFLLYYVPGATHAPHHPTPEWIEKIHALHLFDKGWNALRDEIFARQKKLGVIPKDAKLTPWPSELLKNWDTLSADEQKLFIRQAEVYAAYLAYTDHEIGRVVQAVKDMGKADDTLFIYIVGDNGSSAEGGMAGTPNEIAALNGVPMTADVGLKYYDAWGSDRTYPHMAIGWTWAFDTPFSWTKQIASHFGGIRQGTVIAWPKHITDKGGIRNQFAHFIDVVPTILEVTGIPAPETVDGIPQKPIEGTSLAYTFDKKNARAGSRHTTQYFEMFADRAIYHDGWIASTKVLRPPWQVLGASADKDPVTNDQWELYDLSKDWTQHDDVAAQNPAKLKELQDVFWREAEKYQVLPLDGSVATRVAMPKPSLAAGRSTFTYAGKLTGIPPGDAPSLLNTSYSITAEIEVPAGGAEGMINTNGGRFAGYGFYLLKGKPVFDWNLFGLQHVRWEGPQALAPGKHTLVFDFKYDGLGLGTLAFNSTSGIGQSGTGTLSVDGKKVATQKMEHTIPIILQFDETFDVGADTGTSVNDADYEVPFELTATLKRLTLKLDRPKLTPADEKRLMADGQRNNRVSE